MESFLSRYIGSDTNLKVLPGKETYMIRQKDVDLQKMTELEDLVSACQPGGLAGRRRQSTLAFVKLRTETNSILESTSSFSSATEVESVFDNKETKSRPLPKVLETSSTKQDEDGNGGAVVERKTET